MPLLFDTTTDRRSFIRKASVLTGAAAFAGTYTSLASSPGDTRELRYAFLADTHIPGVDDRETGGGRLLYYDPHGNFSRVLAQIDEAAPDAMAILGDLARMDGQADDYVRMRALLASTSKSTPVFMALGNHDHRGRFLDVFEQPEPMTNAAVVDQRYPIDGPSAQRRRTAHVIDGSPVRIILLDSLFVVNVVSGLLGQPQRRWLETYLTQAAGTPTVIGLHHNLGEGDQHLLDTERFLEIIRPHRNVKAVLYGHSHRLRYEEWEGIHLLNLPAVGYSFDKQPLGWIDARLTPEGGDFTVRAVAGDMAQDGRLFSLEWRT